MGAHVDRDRAGDEAGVGAPAARAGAFILLSRSKSIGYSPGTYTCTGGTMAKYLLQVSYTGEGAKGLQKDGGTKRRKAAQTLGESAGRTDGGLASPCRVG